jgi:peptide/nickel transport system permease protein
MGTDNFGRDVLSRVLHGGRADLRIAVVGVLLSFVPGVFVGVYAGFRGGWVDTLIMRIADVLIAFPSMVLVIAIVAMLGTGLLNIYIAIAATGWVFFSRLARAVTLVAKEKEYTMAAIAIGCRTWGIISRHIVPNAITPCIVFATADVMLTILWVASLGYLGLGIQPPNPEWGTMVAEGRLFLGRAPWISIFPGLAIVITGVVFSLLSDGLTEYLRHRE